MVAQNDVWKIGITLKVSDTSWRGPARQQQGRRAQGGRWADSSAHAAAFIAGTTHAFYISGHSRLVSTVLHHSLYGASNTPTGAAFPSNC
eukprot:6183653-Pleurochrysis_carterae.AAC.5